MSSSTSESAQQIIDAALRPADLVALAGKPGPFATVCFGRLARGEWTEHGDAVQAREALAALEYDGAPPAAIRALEDRLASIPATAHGVVVVTDDHDALLVELLDLAPRRNLARWATLPSLATVVEHRQAQIDTIVVLADRHGADVLVRHGTEQDLRVLEGQTWPITKAAPGGWSQARYQRRAENTWENNAATIAEGVERIARERRRISWCSAGTVARWS